MRRTYIKDITYFGLKINTKLEKQVQMVISPIYFQDLKVREEAENVNPKEPSVKIVMSQPKSDPPLTASSPFDTSMPILTNTPLKAVHNQYHSPSPPTNRQKPYRKQIVGLSSERVKSPEPAQASVQPVPDSTTLSTQETEPPQKVSTPEKLFLPVTPKKPGEFAFKTPHKSPRVPRSPVRTPRTPRHLQTSSLVHLLSPSAGFRKAVPLTPKGKVG